MPLARTASRVVLFLSTKTNPSMALGSQNPPRLILWDVIEEHLDEAEFLFERWNRALFQPSFNLDELAKSFEPRLFAHIDALLVGGPDVAQSFLLPALLSAETSPRATAAGLALLADPDGTWTDAVIEAAPQVKAPLQAALIHALILSDSSGLDATILKRFRAAPTNQHLLQVLIGRGIDPGPLLRASIESKDSSLVTIARNAVQRFGRREFYYLAEIDSHAGSPPSCRELNMKLQSPETIEPALWDLGFCGTTEAGDICATYLLHSNLRVRKLAADSLAWISGFSLSNPEFHLSAKDAAENEPASFPDFHEDDLAINFELDGVDTLPIPNTSAITHWWQRNRDHLAGYRRCLLGRPFSTEIAISALREGPLWRRHRVALELSIRTDGRKHVSTDAFSSRQFQQIAAAV